MVTIQTDDRIILNIWDEDVILCKNFIKHVLSPYIPIEKLENRFILRNKNDIKYIVKEVLSITQYFGFSLSYRCSEFYLKKLLCIISDFYEDNCNIEENIVLLTDELSSNEYILKYGAMFNLISIRIFIYLLQYLKIDGDRDIFTERGQLKTFLLNMVMKYRNNNVYYKIHNDSPMNEKYIDNIMNKFVNCINTLVEDCDKEQFNWLSRIQHYSQLHKFISSSSPLSGNFIVLRFI